MYDAATEGDLFLVLGSRPIGDSTPDEWVAKQWRTTKVAGYRANRRGRRHRTDRCRLQHRRVTTAGRGYRIRLHTSNDDPLAVAPYDRAWFEEVLATVQLQPEDAVD